DLRLKFRLLLTLILFFAVLPFARAGLPLGWSDADIGAPAYAGSASYVNGLWTVAGGGADIFGIADQFNFVSESFNSDGAIVAQVTSVQNSDPSSGWSKAGVMFRNDITAGAVNAMMTATAGQGVSFQTRTTAGAASSNYTISGVANPVWLKLLRSSD